MPDLIERLNALADFGMVPASRLAMREAAALIAEMQDALGPFAREFIGLEGYRDDQDGGELVFGVKVRDFRRAAAVLAKIKGDADA